MIRRLSPHVTALIAAGEVIHGPQDVIKELIENAIDAQASEIKIYLKYGGIEQIVVEDNGVGISPQELSLALERHATSKISTINDLATHSFYGFRGEGLYSIAAVSNFTLRSRRKSDLLGAQISRILPDRVENIISVSMDHGTVVQCDQLFAPVPVRRKLLKSPRVELRRSLDMIRALVLIHPYLSVRVIERNETLLVLQNNLTEFDKRLSQAFPGTIRSKWVCFKREIDQGSIEVWYYSNSTKGLEQIWYVNQRWFQQHSFHKLLQSYLSEGIVIVTMNLKPQYLDINLHPQKHQFGFYYQDSLLNSLSDFFADFFGRRDHDQINSSAYIEIPVKMSHHFPRPKNYAYSSVAEKQKGHMKESYSCYPSFFPMLFLDKNCAIFSQEGQLIMINPFVLSKKIAQGSSYKTIKLEKTITDNKKIMFLELGWLDDAGHLLSVPEKHYSEELCEVIMKDDFCNWVDFYQLIEKNLVDFIIKNQSDKGLRWIFEQDFFIFHQKTKDFIAPFLKKENI